MATKALGFEEMIKLDKEIRKPDSVSSEAAVIYEKSGGGISRDLVGQAMVMFSPPERAGFDQLYAEANFTNMVSSKVDNNLLTVMTPSYTISLNVRTVLEILAQQMGTPLNLPSELNLRLPPPFISNIKEISNYWISEMLCSYQKIFRLNDPLIQKMCHEYFLSLSYPIMVRLAYVEWENRQIEWRVGLKVNEIKVDEAEKTRGIKNDYDKQLETKTTTMKTEMNKLQMENKELWTRIDIINERLTNLKQDEQNRVGEVAETHIKLQSEQARVQQLEKEVLTLKDEIKTLEGQIEEDDDIASWKPDVTSTQEIPVYKNKSLGQILVFPVSIERFRTEYKLIKQEGNILKYETDDGRTFECPDTLIDELVASNDNSTISKKRLGNESIKLLRDNPKWKEIYEFIKSNGGEASTGEIAIGIKGNVSNIRKQYLKEMEERGLIVGEQIGKEKRYSLSM